MILRVLPRIRRVTGRKVGTLDVVDGVLHYKRKDARKVDLELQP